MATRYPVILSIENHCGLKMQKKMAEVMLEVFDEKLYRDAITKDENAIPTPEQLKGKIFVKVRNYFISQGQILYYLSRLDILLYVKVRYCNISKGQIFIFQDHILIYLARSDTVIFLKFRYLFFKVIY